MAKTSWIPEKQAAERLGYTPNYLRRRVRAGKLKIRISSITGRNFFYEEGDIQRLLDNHSTLIS